MEIEILGTSSMVPTKERNHVSIFILHNGDGILLDCGEGTQRQLKHAGIKPSRIKKILISHWHGDHTLGLPGLLQTMAGTDYEGTVRLYGPIGTKEHYDYMMKAFPGDLYDLNVEINEIEKEVVFDGEEIVIRAFPLEHNITCLGYRIEEKNRRRINLAFMKKMNIPEGPLLGRLQEGKSVKFDGKTITPEEATYIVKGKKIGYIADTRICGNTKKIANDVDVLISESTYENKDEEKASEYFHLTAQQAAEIASESGAKKLVLLHFSQRYKTVEQIEDEAKTIFPETVCAYDFMKIKL